MKKLISVLLALIMLLSACAMAAGSEVTISNVRYSDNGGSELDFSGIEIKLAAAETEDKSGASFAVSADGNDVLRAVLSTDEMGAYLSATGISDVYSIPMEMLQEIVQNPIRPENADQLAVVAVGLLERVSRIASEGFKSAGTYEDNGVIYDAYTIDIGHEQFMELVDILDEFLVMYPDVFFMEFGGYASLREMFEGEGIKVRYDGDILSAEDEVMIDIYGYANEEAVANIYLDVRSSCDEASGVNTEDIYIGFFDTSEANYGEELGYIYASVHTDDASGELQAVEVSFGSGEDEADNIYAALSLTGDEDLGMNYFTLGAMDDSFDFLVMWGENYGVFNAITRLNDVMTDTELEMDYVYEDGKGLFKLDARSMEDEISISADVTVTEDDGSWLPEIGETVNIAEADENQMNKLAVEGMGLFSRLLSGLAAANEDFAMLLVSLMQY